MPDGRKPPPLPPNSPPGKDEESGSRSERDGPSREKRRAKDERDHPEVSQERGVRHGRTDDQEEPEEEDDLDNRAVVKCPVCHRMVGGGAIGMASHVEKSKVHAAWLHYNKGVTWREALQKAEKDFRAKDVTWTKRDKAPERKRKSRSPGHGGRGERRERGNGGDRGDREGSRAKLRSVERASPRRDKKEDRRERSRSRRSPKRRKGITKGEEDLILAQAFAIQKERKERRFATVLPPAVPTPAAPPPRKPVKSTKAQPKAVAVDSSESDYSDESGSENEEDRAAAKRLPAHKASAATPAAKAAPATPAAKAVPASKSSSSKDAPDRADLVATFLESQAALLRHHQA